MQRTIYNSIILDESSKIVNKNTTPLKCRSLREVAERINNMDENKNQLIIEKTEKFNQQDELEGYEAPLYKKKESSRSKNGIATFVYSDNGKRMELSAKTQEILGIKNQTVYVACNVLKGTVILCAEQISPKMSAITLKRNGSKLIYYSSDFVRFINSVLKLNYDKRVCNTITNYEIKQKENVNYVILKKCEVNTNDENN